MALASFEQWKGGYVVNTNTGGLAVTDNAAGASWSGGWLRDADGRLVLVSA
jgi:hypothetical protein